jgi:hypothetical protein
MQTLSYLSLSYFSMVVLQRQSGVLRTWRHRGPRHLHTRDSCVQADGDGRKVGAPLCLRLRVEGQTEREILTTNKRDRSGKKEIPHQRVKDGHEPDGTHLCTSATVRA